LFFETRCTVLRPSLSPSVCTEYIVVKRCVLGQKLILTAYRKSYMKNRLVPKWMTLTFAQRPFKRSCQPLYGVNISKTAWARDFKFGTRLCMGMPAGAQVNFPWKWVWPRSRDPYHFWHTIEHISKTTWASDFKFGTRLCVGKECRALGYEWRLMGAIMSVITKSTILISAEFNISPYYSFMVQNQIIVSLCLTIRPLLFVGLCILHFLRWGSTVG